MPSRPQKLLAQRKLNSAVRSGEVTRPTNCERCGSAPPTGVDGRKTIQGHHDDYSRPLAVAWLCAKCHRQENPATKPKSIEQIRSEYDSAPRQAGEFLLSVNGQTFALELRPDRRDCRRWYAFRNGQPYEHGGLEKIWRKVQSELAPLLGERNH